MENFRSILIEDIEIYTNGLEEENFSFCNIISNRMITNAIILDSKKYCLIGAIFKEVLSLIAIIENNEKVVGELKKLINYYLKKEEIEIIDIMDEYNNFYNKIRDLLNPDFERYEENKEYSLYSTRFFLDVIKDELRKQEVPYSRDLIYYGISNELNRVYRNFGAVSQQLILKILMVFSGRIYDYYRFLILSQSPDEVNWQHKYSVLKEKIEKNLKEFNINDDYLENSTELLFEICKEWRIMFVRLMDITPQVQRTKTSIPPEIKEDLRGMVSKVTDSEIEGE